MRELQDGDFTFANEWNALTRDALQGTSVVSGCAVSDGGTNDMTISVASGRVAIDGIEYEVAQQSLTLQSADADDVRYDTVVVGTDATAEIVTGTPSPTPKAPPIPADHVLLGTVEVPAGASGVTDANIFDGRVVPGPATTAEALAYDFVMV